MILVSGEPWERYLERLPAALGRETAAAVWRVADHLAAHYPGFPRPLCGPGLDLDPPLFILGWPYPERDLTLYITADRVEWSYDGPEGCDFGEGLERPAEGTPEAVMGRCFGACMARILADRDALRGAFPRESWWG